MTDSRQLNAALAGNYLLVLPEIRSWSGSKTDREASDEMLALKGASRDAGKFVGYLLASSDTELKAVQNKAAAVRAFVYARTLPWSGVSDGAKRGPRLLAAVNSLDFLSELNKLKQEYDAAVQSLVAVWPQRVVSAIQARGALAAAEDYPDATEIAGYFGIHIDIRPVPAISDFTRLNVPAELAEALGAHLASQAETQLNGAMDDLKGRILAELQRVAAQLGKAGRQEKTRLYDTLVSNMQTLVTLARSMNVTGNPALNELADRIDIELLSRPVEAYRNSPTLAAETADAAQKIAVAAAIDDIWKAV